MAWRCSGVIAPLQAHGCIRPNPQFDGHIALHLGLLTFGFAAGILRHGVRNRSSIEQLNEASIHARGHIPSVVHPLSVVEVGLGNVQLLKPLLDCDIMLLAIVHNLLDRFSCHHNSYNCDGSDDKKNAGEGHQGYFYGRLTLKGAISR